MEQIQKKRKIFVVVSISIILSLILFLYYHNQKATQALATNQLVELQETPSSYSKSESFRMTADKKVDNKKMILVDVKGAVKKPGVYKLENDTRLYDVIEAAGGLVDAEESKLPLAKKVGDQSTVVIPKKGDQTTEIIQEQQETKTNAATDNTSTASIKINQADVAELQKLDGVGQKKAEAIINYRQEHGPFNNLNELTKIKGIGTKTIEKWQDQIDFT